MTTVGRWNPNKVRERVLNGTWVSAEELGGMVLLTPTSIAYTGTSATVGTNGSVDFTACTSISLNGVFSANYDNYMIAMRYASSQSSGTLYYRLRDAGTDESTTSSYVSQYVFADSGSVSGLRQSQNFGLIGGVTTTNRDGNVMYLFGPYLVQPTASRSITAHAYLSATIYDNAVTHNVSDSYDGITLFPNLGNITGLVSVYGLVGA